MDHAFLVLDGALDDEDPGGLEQSPVLLEHVCTSPSDSPAFMSPWNRNTYASTMAEKMIGDQATNVTQTMRKRAIRFIARPDFPR